MNTIKCLPRLKGVGWPTVFPTVDGTGELVESELAANLLVSPNEFCPSCRVPEAGPWPGPPCKVEFVATPPVLAPN